MARLVRDCPLATFREDPTLAADNPHVTNLSASMNKPLYMECESFACSSCPLTSALHLAVKLVEYFVFLQMFLDIRLGKCHFLSLLMVVGKRLL